MVMNPTLDLYILRGPPTITKPNEDRAPISNDGGPADDWRSKAAHLLHSGSHEEFERQHAAGNSSKGGAQLLKQVKVQAIIKNTHSFFHGETVQKIESLRAAFFCDKIKALSFVPYHTASQTYFVRKTANSETLGLIKPFDEFIAQSATQPPKVASEEQEEEYISSKEGIEWSIQSLRGVDPETKVSLKNILNSFLADHSTEIIGISYLNSAGEEKLGIWRKF